MRLPRVLLRGGGDLGSGVAHRLVRCGFPVTILELARPRVIRRTVAFAQAVFAGSTEIEGVRAVLDAPAWAPGTISVRVDPAGEGLAELAPEVVVDARMAKRNLGTRMDQAVCVVALGPGFVAGRDAHYVIETQRGHALGRVLTAGSALPDTGLPGELGGQSARRVVKAPCSGVFVSTLTPGTRVGRGQELGQVNGQPVRSELDGLLRGLLTPGLEVGAGEKLADVDPRPDTDLYTISDKARAVAGGVLEAVMSHFFGA